MELLCHVSLGEVLDKVSILRIKQMRIVDPAKLAHVTRELNHLTKLLVDLKPYEEYLRELREHNEIIWDVEDALRLKEKKGEYDQEFIRLARTAFMTNDRRFAVKNRANEAFGSTLREQKSYQ